MHRPVNESSSSIRSFEPRFRTRSRRGGWGSSALALRGSTIAAINALATGLGVSPGDVVLGAFVALLYRYSAKPQVALVDRSGDPIGRGDWLARLDAGPIVRNFDLTNDPCFKDFVVTVSRSATGRDGSKTLPDRLPIEPGLERVLGRLPLYRAGLSITHSVAPSAAVPWLDGESGDDPLDADSDFALLIDLAEHEWDAAIEFNAAIFAEDMIHLMVGHMAEFLDRATSDPTLPVSRYGILTPPEFRQVVHEWNATDAAFPRIDGVHTLFELRVQQDGERIAVAAGGESLTYAELNARANQLAHCLRSLGVTPGDSVGVCLDRSVRMLVGVLGALKAGAAYVPLDPAFPPDRLKYMIENSGATTVVTLDRLLPLLPRHEAQTLCLDADEAAIAACSSENLNLPVADSDVAYVLYTSGSTGRPKGVEVTHGGFVNYLHSVNQILNITPRDVFMAVITLSFDMCGFDMFSPLAAGAKILLVDRETAMDGRRLRDRLEHSDATVLQATPATWRMIVESGWKGLTARHAAPVEVKPSELTRNGAAADSAPRGAAASNVTPIAPSESSESVRPLIALSGGEALARELADALLACGVEMWNVYGPTETTIYSTMHRVFPGDGVIPIGRPIHNFTHYILDPHRQPVPVGVVGELYIGGVGVGRGYRNRPDLTADRFVTDPFITRHGARMYKTGDLVRYRPDGVIDYLGRTDHQVKIRGFRIEIGEIESSLLKQPGVRASMVVAQENGNGAVRLVAFVAADSGPSMTTAALASGLRSMLPEYMIPAQIVIMPAFPLTLNGKVDRKALPMPPWGETAGSDYVAPKNDVERDLADIFARVLHAKRVGATDSFFELGGDSLSAVSLSMHIQRKFDRPITLAELFRSPTVAELAKLLGDNTSRDASTIMTMRKTGAKIPLFCLPGAGGSSFSYRNLIQRLPEDRPIYAYNIPTLDQRTAPMNTIRDYAIDVLRQIRQIHPSGPFHLLGYSFGGTVAFECAHVMAERGEPLASLGIIDAWGPHYPYKPPLPQRVMLHLHNLTHGEHPIHYLGGRLLNQYWRLLRKWNWARRLMGSRLCLRATGRQAIIDVRDLAVEALGRYEPKPLNHRVDFYRVDFGLMDWPGCIFDDAYNGWRPFVTGELRVVRLPCEHLKVFDESGLTPLTPAVINQLNDGDASIHG